MKLKFQFGRMASLFGLILGSLACLILATTFFSLRERGADALLLVSVGCVGVMALATTIYFVYLVRRTRDGEIP